MDIIVIPSLKDKVRKGFKDIVYFAHEIYQKDTHVGQDAWLRNSLFKTFSFLLCGNRWGKGDCADIKGAWMAFYKPVIKRLAHRPIAILNTSISQDQANIVLHKFEEHGTNKKYFSWIIKKIRYSPFPHIIFKNGITWWFKNASQEGKFLIGFSYLLVNFDELDYQRNAIKTIEEIIEPRTWDYGGYTDVMTTGKGKKNAFRLWKKRKMENNPDYYFHSGDTRENKFINQVHLAKRIKSMNPRLVLQNVQGQWVDSGALISENSIDIAEDISAGLIKEPESGKVYMTGWDLARSSSWCVGITVEISPDLQVKSFERFKENQGISSRNYWDNLYSRIRNRHKIWGGRTIIDSTGLGNPILESLKDIRPVGINLGTSTSSKTRIKTDLITNGVSIIQMGKIGIPWIEHITDSETWTLQDELRDLEDDTSGLMWDGACALFLVLWILFGNKKLTETTPPPPRVIGVKGVNKYAVV